MRTLLLIAMFLALGAGCAPRVPAPAPDDTPNSNPENCTASGGTIVEGWCECPEGYAPDPAGFCLDATGIPGGSMSPDNDLP